MMFRRIIGGENEETLALPKCVFVCAKYLSVDSRRPIILGSRGLRPTSIILLDRKQLQPSVQLAAVWPTALNVELVSLCRDIFLDSNRL